VYRAIQKDTDIEEIIIDEHIIDENTDVKEIFESPITLKEKNYTNYFIELERIKVTEELKGKLKYASWSECWSKLKERYPTSTFMIHENKEGMPYFNDDKIGAFVKVSVTVLDLTHTMFLPVMDNLNKAVKIDRLDSVIINKNIMRALTKCIAFHGLSLYLYKGEEFKEDEK
jgi:hypothetical protein